MPTVNINHMHGLGVLYDKVGATLEVDLLAKALLDLTVNAERIE
jgi:hypothetical protein